MSTSSGNNGNGYGGDEEFTPSERTPRVTPEAKCLANVAVHFTAVGSRLWELARLLDSPTDSRRQLLVVQIGAELAELTITIADTRRVIATFKGSP